MSASAERENGAARVAKRVRGGSSASTSAGCVRSCGIKSNPRRFASRCADLP